MLRITGVELQKQWSTSKYRVRLWKWSNSISSKLSIALVMGLALIPVVPRTSTATVAAAATAQKPAAPKAQAETKLEVALAQREAAAALRIAREAAAAAAAADGGKPIATEQDDSLLQLAAAKRRARQDKREEESEPTRNPSAIATEEPARKPSSIAAEPGKVPDGKPSAEAKAETAAEPEPPKPDVWTDVEVIAALKECLRLLGPIAADIEVNQPVKQEQCGTPAPMLLKRIGSGANKLEFNPPAMLNCQMVVALHGWVEKTLQPAAMETFGSPISRLRSASGYSCRNRVGSAHNADKLSEHAKANAIDIGGFVTADGRTVEVARFWGPTARDIREAERVAAQRSKEERDGKAAKAEPAKAEPAKSGPVRSSSAIATKSVTNSATKSDGPQPDNDQRKGNVRTTELQQPGRSATDAKAVPLPSSGLNEAAKTTVEAGFLRRLHKGACGTFGTVLGPEANEAHRDHFHFDLAARRRNAFCE
jgi:hypothetical protein